MAKKLFTPEHKKFLEKNVKGKPFAELTILFNKHFKTDFNKIQVKGFCHKAGMRNWRPPGKTHTWTQKEILFLKNNAEKNSSQKLTVLINNTFNLSLSRKQVRAACYFYKLKTLRPAPAKCTKEIAAFIMENPKKNVSDMMSMINDVFGTSYTKKQVEGFIFYYKYTYTGYKKNFHNLPLYTEKIKRRGIIYIKVRMEGSYSQRWKEKHRWIWEQAHGEIPKGMEIIFLDNNPQNCELENLAMVSIAESLKMHTWGLCSDNRDATLAGIAVVKHSMAIHGLIKKAVGTEEHIRFVRRESAKRTWERKKQGGKNEGQPAVF